MYIIAAINNYQKRHETETYSPELNALFNVIKEFIVEQEMQNRKNRKNGEN